MSVSSRNAAGTVRQQPVACRSQKQDPPSSHLMQKWIRDQNLHLETIKQLGDDTGSTLEDAGIGKDLLEKSPKAKISKGVYLKLRIFCIAKEALNKMKRQPTQWEEISMQ